MSQAGAAWPPRPPTFSGLAAAILRAGFFLALLFLHPSCADPYGDVANLDSEGEAIVFFGDSVTAGHGLRTDQAFPALVAERLGSNASDALYIVNAGKNGDTSADALARVERDVLALNPRVVFVEFGGNDFRQKVDKQETLNNIDGIVSRISASGSIVVVLEIRIGLLRGKYSAGYKDICDRHGALFIADFMSGVLGNRKLTIDGIHPNQKGHEIIADRVMEELAPLLDRARTALDGKHQAP
jgi:acyl-CoA thioesterase-1